VETLSLERYIDEIAGATIEGISRCKTEKDVWSAVEVYGPSVWNVLATHNGQIISALHCRFPKVYTPALVASLSSALATPSRASLSSLTQEQREREDSLRVSRQRPVLRVCSELALVGIIRDGPGRSGGEWIMKIIKEMVCHTLQAANVC
jgi:regulator of nonsense transcripts 2